MTNDEFLKQIKKCSATELLEIIMENPNYLTDGYYSEFGIAISKRYSELNKNKGDTMDRTYSMKVQKTVQERQYEPFSLALETSFSINQKDIDRTDEILDKEFFNLCDTVDGMIEARLEDPKE